MRQSTVGLKCWWLRRCCWRIEWVVVALVRFSVQTVVLVEEQSAAWVDKVVLGHPRQLVDRNRVDRSPTWQEIVYFQPNLHKFLQNQCTAVWIWHKFQILTVISKFCVYIQIFLFLLEICNYSVLAKFEVNFYMQVLLFMIIFPRHEMIVLITNGN